jgi:parallel beta-helix repeat protein
MKARRLAVVTCATFVALVSAQQAFAGTVRRVPQDYSTIQAAINAAVTGDTVSVSPGTYVERINVSSKEITIESTDGPATTIIDGSLGGTVVTISADPGQRPVFRGFTVRNGYGDVFAGGVIAYGGPALVEGNRVVDNFSCSGGGMEANFSAATFRNNFVSGNRPNCSGGPGGGGILVLGAGTAQILNNTITRNVASSDGGGISLFAAGSPTIADNVISYNSAGGGAGGYGGGVTLANTSNALIENNVIYGNSAYAGGGINWLVPSGQPGPTVVNNTIANNSALLGTAVFADGFDASARLLNNVLVGNDTHAVMECGSFNDLNPPVMLYNDVVNTASGLRYGGTCSDQTGVNGNISADPLFVDAVANDYHLQAASPAIDAGLNSGAPADDIDGDSRPADGNHDGVAVVDIGADEVAVRDTTPPTITCSATPNTLRPPNHTLAAVNVTVDAADESGVVTVTLLTVTSSQADSGLDPEDVPNDIQEWATGTDDMSGLLRAERFREARRYTLTYQARDAAGNTATCAATVTVPLNQKPS